MYNAAIGLGVDPQVLSKGQRSLLHEAATTPFDNSYILSSLVNDHNLDPNKKYGDVRYPIISSAYQGRLSTLKQLIQLGAKVTIQDEYGMNVLMRALRTRNNAMIEYLITNFPELLFQVDNDNRVAVDYVSVSHSKKLQNMIAKTYDKQIKQREQMI